jgi:hypothetical protein
MNSSGFDARYLARQSGGGDIDHSCVRFKKKEAQLAAHSKTRRMSRTR